MQRTALRRQSDSAHHYVDFSHSDPALHSLITLAATTLGFSSAQLNIVDTDLQYTIEQYGEPVGALLERSRAACHHVVDQERSVAVSDSARGRHSSDPFLAAVSESLFALDLCAYVAVPLYGREGLVVGTLCVVDDQPHPADAYTVNTLAEFGRVVEAQLDSIRGRGRAVPTEHNRTIAGAIAAGEMAPWFQPIVDPESGALVAVEALARWVRPAHDGDTAPAVVGPQDFLPSIEGSDLAIDLDHAVLGAALAEFAEWMDQAPAVDLHVNLSARHLVTVDAVWHLDDIVARSSVPPSRVVFELTETESHADTSRAHSVVTDLQSRGFRVLLDDIGTGFSSLGRLLDYPVDGFKIDKAIAAKLGTTVGDSLVSALADFAASTGRSLVIEGIETADQIAIARAQGCDRVQGYVYSRPVPAREIRAMLG